MLEFHFHVCLTTVDSEVLFEVVFVLESLPTLHAFELSVLHCRVGQRLLMERHQTHQ